MNKQNIRKLIEEEQKIERKMRELETEKYKLKDMIKRALPEGTERTIIWCDKSPDRHHTYLPAKSQFTQRGLGKRRCMWCDEDDFDLF